MTDDELNAAIATEVMGWKLMRDMAGSRFYEDADNIMHAPGCWYPATDIANAFEVVERMRADGYWWEMRCPAGRDDDRYVARFEMDADRGRYVFAASHADTLPRATCEAALKAVRS